MARYTKAENIKDLLVTLNEKRAREGKVPVKRGWTGLGHWLMKDIKEESPQAIGRIYTSDDMFIGFLEGLLQEEK